MGAFRKRVFVVVLNRLRRSGECRSHLFEPAGDRPSDLVGTVLLHEVEASDDDAVLIREAARQSPDSAHDEYTGLRVKPWHLCRMGERNVKKANTTARPPTKQRS